MPTSSETEQLSATHPSIPSALDRRGTIFKPSGSGFARADEATLVKQFIKLADSANADREADRGQCTKQLIPIIWSLTCFVPFPSYLDQQVCAACFAGWEFHV